MRSDVKEAVKQNLTLCELIVGITGLGLVAEVVILFVMKGTRVANTVSLWVGVLTAVWMAVHMQLSIEKALEYDAKASAKVMQRSSLLRYAVALVVLAVAGLSGYFNVVTVFIGMIFLKFAAYGQPLVHKPMVKIFGELPPGPSLPDEDEEEVAEEEKQ